MDDRIHPNSSGAIKKKRRKRYDIYVSLFTFLFIRDNGMNFLCIKFSFDTYYTNSNVFLLNEYNTWNNVPPRYFGALLLDCYMVVIRTFRKIRSDAVNTRFRKEN